MFFTHRKLDQVLLRKMLLSQSNEDRHVRESFLRAVKKSAIRKAKKRGARFANEREKFEFLGEVWEIFIRRIKKLAFNQSGDNLEGYFISTAGYLVKEKYKEAKALQAIYTQLPDHFETTISSAPLSSDVHLSEPSNDPLVLYIKSLPTIKQRVVELRCDGWDYRDIGAELGIKEEDARQKFSRIKRYVVMQGWVEIDKSNTLPTHSHINDERNQKGTGDSRLPERSNVAD